jgi:soluble lytic murein transglycosylase-like protein
MKKVFKFVDRIHAPAKFALSALFLVAVIQVPILPSRSEGNKVADALVNPMQTAHVYAGEVDAEVSANLKGLFFGNDQSLAVTNDMINSKVEFVSTRKAYPASLSVIQKHESTIRAKARKNGVPEDVAIGIGLLENGGSDTAKSPAGALGVFQLMPGTARNLGLTVNSKVDDRRNPEKNIDAGMRYLAMNYERFGDWGLSTWAYHAGEGNVTKALKIYAKANHGINLPGIENFPAQRHYVEKYKITIHKLLSDPAVKNFTKKLNDDSSGYPYKVVATAKLFKDAKNKKSARVR